MSLETQSLNQQSFVSSTSLSLKNRKAARKAARRAAKRARQGVVLLLVVTLLVMFLLIGVTGVIVAASFHNSAKSASKMVRQEVRHEDFSDRVIMQLIRGTDFRSALWGHDLLADLYGNDGVFGTVQGAASPAPEVPDPPNTPVGARPNPFGDPDTGNQFIVFHALLIVDKSVAYPAPDHFVGRVLTFVDGPWAGKSTRITKSRVFELDRLVDGTVGFPTSTSPFSQIIYTFAIDNAGGSFDLSNTAAIVGNRFLINGVPFNGTGAGYKTSLSLDENGVTRNSSHTFPDDDTTLHTLNQVIPFAHDSDTTTAASQIHTCLLPNYRAYASGLPSSLAPFIGGADEPHDSVSLQDMPYSWTPSSVSPLTPIIPSYYRYQHIRYLRDVIFTNDQTLDGGAINDQAGTPFIQTPYANLSPEQRLAFWNVMNKAIMRPLSVPNQTAYPINPLITPPVAAHEKFTGGNPAFTLDATETIYQYLSRLAGLGPDGTTPQQLMLDADTDGDQIPDAIWIDPGLPVQTARDGRRYKILAAIQVRDLNACLNVNTMSSGPVQANQLQQLVSANLAVQMPRGRGAGFGPAEITPPNAPGLSIDPTFYSEFSQLLIGTGNVPGRYGDIPGAGEPGAPFAMRPLNDSTNLLPKLKAPAPYTSTDLLGLGQMGFDHDGQPVFVNQALSLSQFFARPEGSPYAFDPLKRNQKFDLPFTEAEIEKILRKFDVDGSINPGRVEVLANQSSFGPVAANLRAFTSISTHIPTPGNLPPAEARRLAAGVNSTYYAQYFLPIYQTRLAALNPDPTNDTQAQLQFKVRTAQSAANWVMPFELQHGYPMNVNRPFGNGADENNNGVIDEILLVGAFPVAEDLAGRAFVDTNRPIDGVGNHSIRDDFPQYGSAVSSFTNGENAFGNGGVVDPRVLYARHLYCSAAFVLAQSGGSTFQYDPISANTTLQGFGRQLTLRRLAQWAINCAEFRDPDGIMTAFEYDLNPIDGWDVDGNPATVEATADVVWGCEQPELLLTEGFSMHDRRVVNVASANSSPAHGTIGGTPTDTNMDQAKFPQGSLFLELYCPRPRPSSNPTNLVRYGAFPPELYNVNAGMGTAALALDRMAPAQPGLPQTARPVWRIYITKKIRQPSTQSTMDAPARFVPPIDYFRAESGYDLPTAMGVTPADLHDFVTYQPEKMFPSWVIGSAANPDQNIASLTDPGQYDATDHSLNNYNDDDRFIWFTTFDPTAPTGSGGLGFTAIQAQRIFYNRQSTSNQIAPGSYCVIGPRMRTPVGTGSQQVLQFQYRSDFQSPPIATDLELRVTDASGATSPSTLTPVPTNFANGNGNVQPMEYIVAASNLPSNWDPTNRESLVVVPAVAGNPAIKALGVNVSMPLAEASVSATAVGDPKVPYYYKGIAGDDNEPNTVAEEICDDPTDNTVAAPETLPFDETDGSVLLRDEIITSGQDSTATTEYYRTAFLQRLANPLLPWNPDLNPDGTQPAGYNATLPINPYITVDWLPIDLTVFNGEVAPVSQDPFGAGSLPASINFSSREKGTSTSSSPQTLFPWTYDVAPLTSASVASSSAVFDFNLDHSLGFLNDALGGGSRKSNMGAATAIYNGSPAQPFPWLAWYNHAYTSPSEVLLVPASAPGRLFQEYGDLQKIVDGGENTNGIYQPSATTLRGSSADFDNGGGSLTYPNGNFLPFPHLLNFFQVSKGLTVSGGAATYSNEAPDFSRLLDLLGLPGPFMGSEQWYNPDKFSEANVATTMVEGYRAPFNYLPNFREAGRLNLNTIGDYQTVPGGQSPVWNALTANLPHDASNATGSPDFHSFNQARMGTGVTNSPELVNNPFRPANAADLMPNFSLPITGVAASQTWGGVDLSQLGTSEVGLLRRDVAGGNPNRPLFHLPTDPSVPANPATRLHSMNRLFNLTTNQANAYAVWITLGKFEVEFNGTFVGSSQIPDGYVLGPELGFDDGTQQRYRSFFILDRSIPVAYETGKNHNASNIILLRRVLE